MATSSIADLFDAYGRQARLYPSLLTILVALLAVVAWLPSSTISSVGALAVTIAGSCGFLYALSSYARTCGKKIEQRLLVEWGGWPTTIALRHTGPLDLYTRRRYHEFLGSKVPNLRFPSEREEQANPAAADAVYASAVRWLKEQARGKEFPMVERENAQYGFRRNLRGLKSLGILVCLTTLVGSSSAIHFTHPEIFEAIQARDPTTIFLGITDVRRAALAAPFFSILGILAWWFIVTDVWVREAGDQYAEALLAVCDRLTNKSTKEAKPEPRIRAL